MVVPKLALVNVLKDTESAPLNLAYLATYLKKNIPVQVKIIDANFENPLQEIKKFAPDIVGISAMTVAYNPARKLAQQIKKALQIPVIIGGVHISTCPESFDPIFDVGVLGEGEETLLELTQIYSKEKSFYPSELKKVDGIVYQENGQLKKTKPKPILDVEKILIPDRTFLSKEYFEPKKSYNRLRGEFVREAGILTSRGCPYKCVFCSTTKFWDKARFIPAQYVAKEIKELAENFNINYIVIYDDLFAVSVKRLEEIYVELNKIGMIGKVKFSCCARANLITDELCKALKKLNAVAVNFGFESGSEKILNFLKAGSVTVEQNKKAVRLCKKHGFEVNGSFMLGSPGETKEDMEKTLELMDFLKEQGVKECWCGVTVPYPGTQLWHLAEKQGLVNAKDFQWGSLNPAYAWNPFFMDKSVSKKEFFKIFMKAKEKSFEMSTREQSPITKLLRHALFISPRLYFLIKKLMS